MRSWFRLGALLVSGVVCAFAGALFAFVTPLYQLNHERISTQFTLRAYADDKRSIRSYPNSSEGLEELMRDMIAIQERGDTATLASYFQSLVLPHAERWFKSRFGEQNCGQHAAANDCLGPRLFVTYTSIARSLPMAAALTLSDLIDEKLTNFEAVNYTELCPGPRRIVPAPSLFSELSTTPILSSVSRLVQKHEPVYVLWSYSETEETTVGFFVYSEGAFRFIGMPHPASLEELADAKKTSKITTRPAVTPSGPTDDLTNEVVMQHPILVDPAALERTVVLEVAVDENGDVVDVSYVRGPEKLKTAAIQTARERQFKVQLLGQPIRTSTCVSVVPPQ